MLCIILTFAFQHRKLLTLNEIIRAEGYLGLWKGVPANIRRAFLVNMGELACHDNAERFIIQNQVCHENIYADTLCSDMSGLPAKALICPADVVKTRMMNQAAEGENKIKYRNSVQLPGENCQD